MKKLLSIITIMFLISCAGNWNDDDVKAFHKYCPMNKTICNCILDAAQVRYSSFKEFEKAGEKKSRKESEWMRGVQENCSGS